MPLGYCTKQDLVTRFGEKELSQLTTDSSTDHSIVDARLDSAIDGAEAEINFWLSACYTLPLLIPTPLIIREWAMLISRYKLYTQIRLLRGEAGQQDHQSRRDYQDVLSQLKKACEIVLWYPDGEPVIRPPADVPEYAVAPRYDVCTCDDFNLAQSWRRI